LRRLDISTHPKLSLSIGEVCRSLSALVQKNAGFFVNIAEKLTAIKQRQGGSHQANRSRNGPVRYNPIRF
jgi:hypothetical protein